MSYPVFHVPAGDVLPVMFSSYAGSTGASVTLTGLAVTDIEIYKDGSTTQRASDAGYTLLDTDGIDFDGITGIHGFSIDTGDNTDAGFYTVGAWFTVVVSAVTIDSQTVNFIACQFRIMAAEGVAGVPDVNVTHVGDTAQTAGDIIGDTNDIQSRLPAALTAGGNLKADVDTIKTQSVTCAAGVTVLASVGTAATSTAQTGDSFARLGAPAGASVSADIAAIKVDTAAILDDTGTSGVVVAAGSKTGYSITTGGIGTGDIDSTALNEIADAILDRVMSAGSDSGGDNTTARTVRQALRTLRNRVNNAAGTLTVYKEDDSTASWTAATTQTPGDPISQINPT